MYVSLPQAGAPAVSAAKMKGAGDWIMAPGRRLKEIASIIEAVDNRCMAADGPVTPTRLEMTDEELRHIYALATGKRRPQ